MTLADWHQFLASFLAPQEFLRPNIDDSDPISMIPTELDSSGEGCVQLDRRNSGDNVS